MKISLKYSSVSLYKRQVSGKIFSSFDKTAKAKRKTAAADALETFDVRPVRVLFR